jgi:hypothetical protein
MSESSLPTKPKTPLLGDTTYALVKQTAALVLPAVGALYFALAQIWHFPNSEGVVGTIAAVNTFFGVVLGMATRSYNNSDTKYAGDLVVEDHPEDSTQKIIVAHLNEQPETVASLHEAIFKVKGE